MDVSSIRIHPLGTINICWEFHGRLAASFGKTLLWTDWSTNQKYYSYAFYAADSGLLRVKKSRWGHFCRIIHTDPHSICSYIYMPLRYTSSSMECSADLLNKDPYFILQYYNYTEYNISAPLPCVEAVVISLKPTLFPGGWIQSQLWYLGTLLTQNEVLSHWVLASKGWTFVGS